MPPLQDCDRHTVLAELRESVVECASRGLTNSAKWAAEHASCLANHLGDVPEVLPTGRYEPNFLKEWTQYQLAKSYFDLKEFRRAAHSLRSCRTIQSTFLKLYSLYLAGEKGKQNEVLSRPGQKPKNKELPALRHQLALMREQERLDGYCCYLYAVVLHACGVNDMTMKLLVEAVNQAPLLWAAWELLAQVCTSLESVSKLELPDHWVKELFLVQVNLQLHCNNEVVAKCEALTDETTGIPGSPLIMGNLATAYYNRQDFETAAMILDGLHHDDPYRLDMVDIYSNMQYVLGNKAQLSHLAHHVMSVDKYRAETCFVIANYYSMEGVHTKAVLYFHRALKLNPNYVSAWTLMGHEYMELKNTHAAVQAYHSAIECNPRDYRAWYGLGQAYEILKLPNYSLYYFSRGQQLRPSDSRMLVALGDCYDALNKPREASKCYQRAIFVGDTEGVAYARLAKLQENLQDFEKAANTWARLVEQYETSQLAGVTDDVLQAYQYLASYFFRKDELSKADHFAQKCLQFDETREHGRSLLSQTQQKRTEAKRALEEPS